MKKHLIALTLSLALCLTACISEPSAEQSKVITGVSKESIPSKEKEADKVQVDCDHLAENIYVRGEALKSQDDTEKFSELLQEPFYSAYLWGVVLPSKHDMDKMSFWETVKLFTESYGECTVSFQYSDSDDSVKETMQLTRDKLNEYANDVASGKIDNWGISLYFGEWKDDNPETAISIKLSDFDWVSGEPKNNIICSIESRRMLPSDDRKLAKDECLYIITDNNALIMTEADGIKPGMQGIYERVFYEDEYDKIMGDK